MVILDLFMANANQQAGQFLRDHLFGYESRWYLKGDVVTGGWNTFGKLIRPGTSLVLRHPLVPGR
jgi:hypothetical protein